MVSAKVKHVPCTPKYAVFLAADGDVTGAAAGAAPEPAVTGATLAAGRGVRFMGVGLSRQDKCSPGGWVLQRRHKRTDESGPNADSVVVRPNRSVFLLLVGVGGSLDGGVPRTRDFRMADMDAPAFGGGKVRSTMQHGSNDHLLRMVSVRLG
jgi:hypothetical protein